MTIVELYMVLDKSSGKGWRSNLRNARILCVFAHVFRFQALELVFTPCTDQGCVLYVYKLPTCLCMVYGGYMGNMYIYIGVYPYPPGLQPGIEWNWFSGVSRLTRHKTIKVIIYLNKTHTELGQNSTIPPNCIYRYPFYTLCGVIYTITFFRSWLRKKRKPKTQDPKTIKVIISQ